MTCDSTAKCEADSGLIASINLMIQSISENEVISADKVEAGAKLILEHANKFSSVSVECLETLIKFVTLASANGAITILDSFPRAVSQMYNYATKGTLSKTIVKKLSSLSVTMVNIFGSDNNSESDVLESALKFHSLEGSQESQQLLEMAAVQCTKKYMKFYESVAKTPSNCSGAELSQLAALISPLSLLVISR